MIRKGAKELSPALKAFPDSLESPEEPGVFLNLTQSEIRDTKGGYRSHEEYLDSCANESVQEQETDRDMER